TAAGGAGQREAAGWRRDADSRAGDRRVAPAGQPNALAAVRVGSSVGDPVAGGAGAVDVDPIEGVVGERVALAGSAAADAIAGRAVGDLDADLIGMHGVAFDHILRCCDRHTAGAVAGDIVAGADRRAAARADLDAGGAIAGYLVAADRVVGRRPRRVSAMIQ